VLNRTYQTFARTCGVAVDVCRPATPTDKGKVERTVSSVRSAVTDLLTQPWASLDGLQEAPGA
jgi:transposase